MLWCIFVVSLTVTSAYCRSPVSMLYILVMDFCRREAILQKLS